MNACDAKECLRYEEDSKAYNCRSLHHLPTRRIHKKDEVHTAAYLHTFACTHAYVHSLHTLRRHGAITPPSLVASTTTKPRSHHSRSCWGKCHTQFVMPFISYNLVCIVHTFPIDTVSTRYGHFKQVSISSAVCLKGVN